MQSKSWMQSEPLHIALRAYALSLSLSLGPSLIPLITSFLTTGVTSTNIQTFKQLMQKEFRLDGFAFAMSLSVGGGAAIREIWRVLEILPPTNLTYQDGATGKTALLSLSPIHKTFLSNTISSSFGILLLQAGRRRSGRLRHRFPSRIAHYPLAPSTVSQTSNTLDLTLLLLVRAADTLLQNLMKRSTTSNEKHRCSITLDENKFVTAWTSRIDAFVFWICSARIMWCFFYEPARLPKSYVKWIATLANLDKRVIHTLQLLREGRWSYVNGSEFHKNILKDFSTELGHSASWGDPVALPAYGGPTADAIWKILGVRSRPGVGGLPCELVHGPVGATFGLEGSCFANLSIRGATAFLEAAVIYLPVHFLPVIVTRPHSLLEIHQILNTLYGALRSATFLSAFVTLYWSAVCITRSLVFARLFPLISHDIWDGPFGCIFVGSLVCGSSIWIENGRRRCEMALYVLPRALRAWLPDTWLQFNGKTLHFVERLAFVLSFSTLMTTATHSPGTLRGVSKWALSYIMNGPLVGLRKWKRNNSSILDTSTNPLRIYPNNLAKID